MLPHMNRIFQIVPIIIIRSMRCKPDRPSHTVYLLVLS